MDAEAFGKQLAEVVKEAMKKTNDPIEARLLGLEARINLLEAEAAAKATKKERKG